MALQFGVSRLCTLLLWGCICFPPKKGYNIAHGYSLNDDTFSSHAGVLGPLTSNQFHSGASLNPNQDSVSPRDEIQDMMHQSVQREPVQHENNKDASFVSLSDEMIKNEPESEHDVPSSPPVSKHDNKGSGYQHPFGLLVKAHTQEKNTAGTSFSSIKDFKQFIESLKTSYLMPGSDLGRHFHTARETIENEMASNTQNVNNNEQQDTGYRSYSAEEGTAHDDASGNEDWSDAMNTAIEQDANYQMPSESLFVPDPVDSTASLISTRVYDGQGSALSPRHHLAATEHVSSNDGGFGSGGISGENPAIFTSAPHVRNKAVQSTSSKFPEQIPSGSFFGDDLSFSGHVTASPVDPRSSPSQDFSHYSRKDLTSEKTIQQQPKYTFHSKDSLTQDRKLSGGLELGKDVQSQERSRVTPANILSAPMPSSLNSYGHVLYDSAPRDQLYVPDYQPEHNQRPAKSSQAYQPTVGRQSNSINHVPTAHLPVSSGSVLSRSNTPSPQSRSVLVGLQTSSPHDAQNVAFNRKKPVRFFTRFTGQPSSSLDGSSRHGGYLQDKTVSVSPQSVYTHTVKSRNGYRRSKVSLTKDHYEPLSAGCRQEH